MKKRLRTQSTLNHKPPRLLSFMIAVLLLFGAVSPSVSFALDGYRTDTQDGTDGSVSSESEALSLSGEITYTEIKEKRDAFTKHFKRSDGKYVAVLYSEPVHTVKDGQYVNLDNRLIETANGRYETVNDAFWVSFAKKASDDDTVLLSFEGYTLSWNVSVIKALNLKGSWQKLGTSVQESVTSETVTPQLAQDVSGVVRDVALCDANERSVFSKEEISSTFMSVSGFSYRNAFSSGGSVDLKYTVSDNRLEEDIIVNQKGDIASYVVSMTAAGLTAVLQDDNSVVFYEDDGKALITIGAPWMCDDVGAYSFDVTVSLRQNGDEVTIVYTPDAEWMNADERVYPIVIDPSVRSRDYTANYQDTTVYTGSTASTNTANLSTLLVGKQSDKEHEAYIKLLNYPMVLDYTVRIDGVTFKVYGNNVGTNLKMKVITTPWDISTLTFDNRPTGSGTAYSPTSITNISSALNEFSFDLLPAIKEYEYSHASWTGFFEEYFQGIRLYSYPIGTTRYTFRSSEITDSSLRPCIEIEYHYDYIDPVYDGGIYSIINLSSGKSLTATTTGSNVYQSSHSQASSHAFRLNGYGAFKIESIERSGKVLTYAYSGDETQNTSNLYTTSASSSMADHQEFIFVFVDEDSHGYPCYAIVSRADTTMAITAIGTSNGSSTSTGTATAGNVVMAKYTGASSQLWYLESGSKPVFNGENIIALNGDELRYDYNIDGTWIQPHCYVTTYGETITWSSSDASVVSIATNGKTTVTGVGSAVLTATVSNADAGTTRSYSYTVNIGIPNGVYRIKNAGTGKYLSIPGESYANSDDAVMSDLYTSGWEQYGQLWKVYYIGNGRYSIRLLPQMNMGLDVTSSIVDIWKIGFSDTNVPNYAKWDIVLDENNYILRLNGDSSKVITAGTTVTVTAYNESSTQHWHFEEYDIEQGVTLFNPPKWLAPKESGEVTAVVYSDTPIASTVTLSSTNSAIAKIDNNKVVGVSEGTVQINVTSSEYSSLKTWFWVTVTPLENNVYIFENKETGRSIQPDDNGENHIEQFEFDSEWYQFWFFIRADRNYYYIINKDSGLYLTSPNSSESDVEITVAPQSSALQSRQLWKVTSLSDKSCILQSQMMEEYSLVMAVGAGLNANGVNIQQREYIDNTDQSQQWAMWNTNVESFVPYISQGEGTAWCWVTCAQMMVRAMYPELFASSDEDTLLAERQEMVYYIFGDESSNAEDYDWQTDLQGLKTQTGNFKHVGMAAAYLAGEVGASVTYSASATPYREEYLVGLLANGYPICRLYGWLVYSDIEITDLTDLQTLYDALSPQSGGHVTVISGCRWDENTNKYMFIINDPASSSSTISNTYELSYQQLLFEWDTTEEMNKITLWFPSVTPKTKFAEKTFLEEVFLEYEYSS